MDILKIVNDKVTEMLDEGVVETLIAETVESTITKTIKDTFSSYHFRKDIEDKLKTEVDGTLESISFESYRNVMLNQMTAVVEGLQGETFAQMAKAEYESIFGNSEPLKLSDLFEMIREDYKDDEGGSYEEYFTLILDDERRDEKFLRGWIHIYFDEEDDTSKYRCANNISLIINEDGSGRIERLKLSGVDYSEKQFRLGYMKDWEKRLLNAYFSKTPIVIDVDDADDVDTSKWDEQ